MELCVKHLTLRIMPSDTGMSPESVPDAPLEPIATMFIVLTSDQIRLLKTMWLIDDEPQSGVVKGENILWLYSIMKEELQKKKEDLVERSKSSLPGLVISDDSKGSPELIVMNSDSFSAALAEADSPPMKTTTFTLPPSYILF